MLTTQRFGRIGLGCMGLSGNYGKGLSDDAFIALIKDALNLGIRIFDTADCYDETSDGKGGQGASGHNERLLGQALHESGIARADLCIASKCGFVTKDWSIDLSPRHIHEACEASLENLNTAYIDIYYLHRLPKTKQALTHCLEALMVLLHEGKIKQVGLSEASAEMIQHAHDYFVSVGMPNALAAVENEFSLFTQEVLHNGVLTTCQRLGLAFVPYSPLCRGLLTDVMNKDSIFIDGDFRAMLPRFQGNNFLANLAIKDELALFAKNKGCSLPQLALAWLLTQGNFIFPIPGSRKLSRIQENLGALDVSLNANDLHEIDIIVNGLVQGDRYTDAMRKMQNLPAHNH